MDTHKFHKWSRHELLNHIDHVEGKAQFQVSNIRDLCKELEAQKTADAAKISLLKEQLRASQAKVGDLEADIEHLRSSLSAARINETPAPAPGNFTIMAAPGAVINSVVNFNTANPDQEYNGQRPAPQQVALPLRPHSHLAAPKWRQLCKSEASTGRCNKRKNCHFTHRNQRIKYGSHYIDSLPDFSPASN